MAAAFSVELISVPQKGLNVDAKRKLQFKKRQITSDKNDCYKPICHVNNLLHFIFINVKNVSLKPAMFGLGIKKVWRPALTDECILYHMVISHELAMEIA